MHEAAFFCFGAGQGGAEEKNFRGGQGWVIVKLGGIFGVEQGSLESFRGRGSPGSYFSRGRGGAGRASLIYLTLKRSSLLTLLALLTRTESEGAGNRARD